MDFAAHVTLEGSKEVGMGQDKTKSRYVYFDDSFLF